MSEEIISENVRKSYHFCIQCAIMKCKCKKPPVADFVVRVPDGNKMGERSRRMRRKQMLVILLAVCMVFSCSGCLFVSSAEELYALPQGSREYMDLQKQINDILESGAEYSAPLSGSNRQAVQLQDLNGDGTDEAVGFFTSSGERSLNIRIFQVRDGKYDCAAVVEGDGTAIESVNYVDMDDDGVKEMVVGWQMSASVRLLTIYSVRDFQISPLLSTNYEKYSLADLNAESGKNVIVYRSAPEEGAPEVEVYSLMQDGEITSATARLSEGVTTIVSIKQGKLLGNRQAVFVDSEYADGGLITDILVSEKPGELLNVTLGDDGRRSESTLRAYTSVYSMDINGDGIVEVPQPRELPAQSETVYRVIDWRAYRKNGASEKALTTYHNYSDGWFLRLPDAWENNLTIRREDSVSGERTIIFSKITGEGEAARIEDFLAVYTLTGDNRMERSQTEGRFVLKNAGTSIYAARILSQQTDMPVSQEYVTQNFELIGTDWTNGIA